MMRLWWIVTLAWLRLSSVQAHAAGEPRPFDDTEVTLTVTYLGLLAADLWTTERLHERPNAVEYNPLLPEKPTDAQLLAAGVVAASAVVFAAHRLPEWRREILWAAVAVEAWAAGTNGAKLALRVSW